MTRVGDKESFFSRPAVRRKGCPTPAAYFQTSFSDWDDLPGPPGPVFFDSFNQVAIQRLVANTNKRGIDSRRHARWLSLRIGLRHNLVPVLLCLFMVSEDRCPLDWIVEFDPLCAFANPIEKELRRGPADPALDVPNLHV